MVTIAATESAQSILALKNFLDSYAVFYQGVRSYTAGVDLAASGAGELSDGLKQFSEEGVQRVVDVVNDNLEGKLERLRSTLEVSEKYRNFADDGKQEGKVKFIYRTEEIKAD